MIKCIKCLAVSVYIYIYISLHLSDRELLPETEMAVLVCATMHLQPCGIMRLVCHALFRFLFPQIKPTAYAFTQVRRKTVPLGKSFLTVILSTSHHHLAGQQMQFARAAKENGRYPRLNQVAEVAILGDWEELGQSSIRSPKRSAEYDLCHIILSRNILPGTSMLLAFHGRT